MNKIKISSVKDESNEMEHLWIKEEGEGKHEE
jgi:hypothetical protein